MAMLRRGQARPAALIALSFFILALMLAPISSFPASAQTSAPVIETASLRLWPEYDDPGLLVILAGQFGSDTAFPLQAAFPAPAGIRNVQATYEDASSSLINRTFEIKDGKLTYELPSTGFQVEYYLDRAPGGEQRNISYSFVAPYAIKALRVEVQQPARSTGFAMTPASETSQKGSDDLTYYVFNRSNVAAGEKLDITISYSKTDTGLSAPQIAVAQTGAPVQAPAQAAAPAATSATNVLPWVLIGLGVVLLVGILVFWLLSQRRVPAQQQVRSTGPNTVRSAPAARGPRATVPARPNGEAVSFCTNCGHALGPDDRFCSQCGAPRRP